MCFHINSEYRIVGVDYMLGLLVWTVWILNISGSVCVLMLVSVLILVSMFK